MATNVASIRFVTKRSTGPTENSIPLSDLNSVNTGSQTNNGEKDVSVWQVGRNLTFNGKTNGIVVTEATDCFTDASV